MKTPLVIGILAFHGDVAEHRLAMEAAAEKLKIKIQTILVRTKTDLKNIDALILPGGESPTLEKLSKTAGIWSELKKIKNIFGTCAGAILLAQMKLMEIGIERNAYGAQIDSFEETISTTLGKLNAIFIRAPKIKSVGIKVTTLATRGSEIIACEEKSAKGYYLAACFHPELTSTIFHEHFLKQILKTI